MGNILSAAEDSMNEKKERGVGNPSAASGVIPAFEREDRYLVLKRRDIAASLTETEREMLNLLAGKVAAYREVCKAPFACVVVERDWPEYEPTWKAIEARMRINRR